MKQAARLLASIFVVAGTGHASAQGVRKPYQQLIHQISGIDQVKNPSVQHPNIWLYDTSKHFPTQSLNLLYNDLVKISERIKNHRIPITKPHPEVPESLVSLFRPFVNWSDGAAHVFASRHGAKTPLDRVSAEVIVNNGLKDYSGDWHTDPYTAIVSPVFTHEGMGYILPGDVEHTDPEKITHRVPQGWTPISDFTARHKAIAYPGKISAVLNYVKKR